MVIVSLMTEEPSYEKIKGLTFATTSEEEKQATRSSWSRGDAIASVVVVLLILIVYLSFTG